MGCYWDIEGTVKPQNGQMQTVAAILKRYECDFMFGIEEGTFDVSFCEERGYSFADDLADELKPYLHEGEINAHDNDQDAYCRYEFYDGECTFRDGEKFIYYKGSAEDFAEQLPDEVIKAVLKKYAKASDNKKESGV